MPNQHAIMLISNLLFEKRRTDSSIGGILTIPSQDRIVVNINEIEYIITVEKKEK